MFAQNSRQVSFPGFPLAKCRKVKRKVAEIFAPETSLITRKGNQISMKMHVKQSNTAYNEASRVFYSLVEAPFWHKTQRSSVGSFTGDINCRSHILTQMPIDLLASISAYRDVIKTSCHCRNRSEKIECYANILQCHANWSMQHGSSVLYE